MIGPFSGAYRFLSNFWIEPHRGGLTNEHYYQAEKTLEPVDRAFIMQSRTSGEAKRRGALVDLRPDWEEVKESVMLSNLRNKFYLDLELGTRLLDTGDIELVEVNHWGDRYWGVDGTGQNRLGALLMQVRSELASYHAV